MVEKNYIIGEPNKGRSGYNMSVKTPHPAFGTHTIELDLDNPPPLTPGEKWFDVLDWFGLGWGLNAAVGMTLADKITYGSGQPFLKKLTSKLETFDAIKKTGKAGTMANIGTLLLGGYAIMAPVKWLEDHKQEAVTWLDKGYEHKNITMQRKADIEARHEYLKHEPKQGWGSIMLGRTASVLAILTFHFSIAGEKNIANVVVKPLGGNFKGFDAWSNGYIKGFRNILRKNKTLDNFFARAERRMELTPKFHYEEFEKTAKATKAAGKTPKENLFTYRAPGTNGFDKKGNPLMDTGEDRVHTWMYNVNIEALYTFAVAGITYVASKTFAHLFEKKEAPDKRQLIVEKTDCPEGITYTRAEYMQKLQQEQAVTNTEPHQSKQNIESDHAQLDSKPLAEATDLQETSALSATTPEKTPATHTVAQNSLAQTLANMHAKTRADALSDTTEVPSAKGDISTHDAAEQHRHDSAPDGEPPSKKTPSADAPSSQIANVEYNARQKPAPTQMEAHA